MTPDLVDAVVGWRLMIAGPAHACLRMRAHALQCGVADDEITVATTAVAIRDVRCALCGTVTSAKMNLEDVLPCARCGQSGCPPTCFATPRCAPGIHGRVRAARDRITVDGPQI